MVSNFEKNSCDYQYTDSPPHLIIAATLPCKTEHSVYYYIATAKWTKITKEDRPVGSQLLEQSTAVTELANNVMLKSKTLFKMCIADFNARCKDDVTAD